MPDAADLDDFEELFDAMMVRKTEQAHAQAETQSAEAAAQAAARAAARAQADAASKAALEQLQEAGRIRLAGMAKSALYDGDALDPTLDLADSVIEETEGFIILAGPREPIEAAARLLAEREGKPARRAAIQMATALCLPRLHLSIISRKAEG